MSEQNAPAGQSRTFNVNVAVHRADPEETTDGYRISIPGFEMQWSGDKDLCQDIWAYLWKTHFARLVRDMSPEELTLFFEKLNECDRALKDNPEIERAEMSLTGTRSAATEWKVFRVNDCYWVAARSAEEAVSFYLSQPENEGLSREEAVHEPVEECPLTDEMYIDLGNTEMGKITYAAVIAARLAKGEAEPFTIASTEY